MDKKIDFKILFLAILFLIGCFTDGRLVFVYPAIILIITLINFDKGLQFIFFTLGINYIIFFNFKSIGIFHPNSFITVGQILFLAIGIFKLKKIKLDYKLLFFFIFTALNLLSLIYTADWLSGIKYLPNLILYSLTLLFFYNYDAINLEKIFKLIIWNALIIFIIIYPFQYLIFNQPAFISDYNRGDRFFGGGIHPVPLAFFMVLLFYSSIFLFEKLQQKRYLLITLASSIFLILTYGRTAIAGLLITGLIYLFYKKKLKYAIPIIIIILLFSAGLIINFFLIKGTIYQDNLDFVTSGRLSLWELSFKSFLKHPFLGMGAGSSDVVMQPYNLGTPHNDFIRVLIETGIFGLVSFLLYLGLQMKSIFKNVKDHALIWSLFLFFILTLIFDNSLDYNIYFTFSIFVLLGITNRLNYLKNKTRGKNENTNVRN